MEGGIAAWNAGGQVIYADSPKPTPQVASYPKELEISLKHPPDRRYDKKLTLTSEELRYFDGQDGRPSYVAVDGIIYNLTQSRLWRGGVHDPSEGQAKAGEDLSEVIKKSPHGKMILQGFPVVGSL